MMSGDPPAGVVTTKRTGRVGQACSSSCNGLHCQGRTNLHIGSKSKSPRLSNPDATKKMERPVPSFPDDREPWWQRKRDLDCPTEVLRCRELTRRAKKLPLG